MEKKSVTVLDLRDSPWVDGPGRTILDCAESLNGQGINFVIGGFGGGQQNKNEYVSEAVKRGLTAVTIEEKSSFDREVIKTILKLVDEYEVDVIHSHDFRSNVFALLCAKKKSIRIISTVHGWIANDLKGKVYVFIDKLILRMFDEVVAVSYGVQRKLLRALISKKKVSIIQNALKLEQYIIDRENSSFRKELRVGEETVVIANIGRLSPEKGQMEFVNAASSLLKKHKNILFLLIGIGPEESRIRDRVKELGIESFVRFCGFRKDMVDVYNGVDLVVQSSITEGMPNVILESLLMAVPVVATDVGGTGEVLSNGVGGILIPAADHDALVDAVEKYLENRTDYLESVKSARSDIQVRFDHNLRAKKLGQLYLKNISLGL